MNLDRGQNNGLTSPYLNFDPSILKPSGSSQFVIPEGQGEHRGKMETSFTKIGAAVAGGGLFGGVNGLYQGYKEASISQASPAVKRTMMINFIGKQGSSSSQVFGSVALMFSLYDTLITNVRDVDDQFNIIPAAGLACATYSIPKGLRSVAKGGAFGTFLALAYLGFTNSDSLLAQMPDSGKSKY